MHVFSPLPIELFEQAPAVVLPRMGRRKPVGLRIDGPDRQKHLVVLPARGMSQGAQPSTTFDEIDPTIDDRLSRIDDLSTGRVGAMLVIHHRMSFVFYSTLCPVRRFSTQWVSNAVPSRATYFELLFFTQSSGFPP